LLAGTLRVDHRPVPPSPLHYVSRSSLSSLPLPLPAAVAIPTPPHMILHTPPSLRVPLSSSPMCLAAQPRATPFVGTFLSVCLCAPKLSVELGSWIALERHRLQFLNGDGVGASDGSASSLLKESCSTDVCECVRLCCVFEYILCLSANLLDVAGVLKPPSQLRAWHNRHHN
jgi:hypothetical protein